MIPPSTPPTIAPIFGPERSRRAPVVDVDVAAVSGVFGDECKVVLAPGVNVDTTGTLKEGEY